MVAIYSRIYEGTLLFQPLNWQASSAAVLEMYFNGTESRAQIIVSAPDGGKELLQRIVGTLNCCQVSNTGLPFSRSRPSSNEPPSMQITSSYALRGGSSRVSCQEGPSSSTYCNAMERWSRGNQKMYHGRPALRTSPAFASLSSIERYVIAVLVGLIKQGKVFHSGKELGSKVRGSHLTGGYGPTLQGCRKRHLEGPRALSLRSQNVWLVQGQLSLRFYLCLVEAICLRPQLRRHGAQLQCRLLPS